MAFLANHPKSTVGVLARSLNLDPEYVAVCVMQLARAGEIDKSADGYSSANRPGEKRIVTPSGVERCVRRHLISV